MVMAFLILLIIKTEFIFFVRMDACAVFIILFILFSCCCCTGNSYHNKKRIDKLTTCIYMSKEFIKFVEFVCKNDVKIKKIEMDFDKRQLYYSMNRCYGTELSDIDIFVEFNNMLDLYCKDLHDGKYIYTSGDT